MAAVPGLAANPVYRPAIENVQRTALGNPWTEIIVGRCDRARARLNGEIMLAAVQFAAG